MGVKEEKVELDGSFPTKERNEHLDLALFVIELIDLATEVRERAIDNADGIAHGELHLHLRRLGSHALQHVLRFVFGELDGLVL